MKRLILFIILSLGLLKSANAFHLKGGWIQYEYLGAGANPNTSKYRITVRQYLLCSSTSSQIDGQIFLGIFDAGTNVLDTLLTVDSVKNGSVILNKVSYDPCINPKPPVCYLINKYVTTIDLPNNDVGYVLAVQRCCRITGIVNIYQSNNVGITYSNTIPGGIYRNNNSPSFVQKDTVLVCYNSPFTFDFSASDTATAFAPSDSLAYTFCDGLTGGDSTNSGARPDPPSNPPFTPIPYSTPYSGSSPMGSSVTIDPITGIISGVAPSTVGDYAVAVCAQQFRDGILIGSTKKEIHITVGDCSLKAAELKPAYINCNNLTFNFFNESSNPNIVSYLWVFGDSLGSPVLDTSLSATPTHVYSDTGIYRISLTVQSLGGCVDSAKSLVRVYPGFKANFVWKGTCLKNPYYFIDSSYSQYGKVNNWNWNLGEPAASDDTIQDPSYTYQSTGQKTVTLKVSNTNGCEDSTTQVITILTNPAIVLSFDSTLICSNDTIQLSASEQNAIGNATFTWTSIDSLSIINPNSANPFVDPKDTAIYYVSLSDSGCFAMDSVIVNTVPKITVKAGPDSSICQTDSIKLYALTQGTTIGWTSSTAGEKVDSVFTPWVRPLVNPTNYYVVANLHDKCFAWDTITINVYPYPIASGADDSVCFGGSIQLNASISNNAFFYWSPTYSLLDSSSLYPIASPDSTTHYVLTAYYKGTDVCPKLVTDTITIRVIPKVIVDLGDDTTVVVHEPLHLFVKGNTDSTTASYLWYTPNGSATFLDDNHSQDPTAIFQDGTDSITYIVNATLKNPKACSAQDTIKIIIFQTPPEVFVPSAFTPDANINKTIRPIPVGILQLDYFSIYNRFGQLLFTTSQIGVGWDGTYKGVPQPPGTYVYTVQAESYLRRPLPGKGTIVLIR